MHLLILLQAGIISGKDSRQLVIALEPEAASIYCRSLDVNQFIEPSGQQSSPSFREGTKYLVIDAGGNMTSIYRYLIVCIIKDFGKTVTLI